MEIEFYITDSLYTYSYIPEPGSTRIEFALTDKYGNTESNELLLPVPVYVAVDQYLAELEEEVEEELEEEIIVEEILLKEPMVDSSVIVKATEVKVFKERMADQAEGNLKETLENLDTEKEEIYSTYELISFLGDNAELLGYTEEELAVLLAMIASNGNTDVNEFKTSFSPFTSGGLKTALNDVNLGKKRIKSIEDLILELLKNKDDYNFTSSDLMNALITMISELDIDMTKIKDYISEDEKEGQGKAGKVLIWLLGLAGTFIIFLLYRKRKKKDDR